MNTERKFIVRRDDGYAQKFVENNCGTFPQSVTDSEATPFATVEAAQERADSFGVRFGNLKVEPVTQKNS